MATQIRKQVEALYRISWWRGFAFGVVIESTTLPPDVSDIDSSIDTRNTRKGCWQWTVIAGTEPQTVVGIHTWIEGYLSPAYRAVLKQYESAGWMVGDVKKENDQLMKFLTSAARLKGIRLREFER